MSDKIDKNFNLNNRELRLQGRKDFIRHVIEYMKKNKIRKRSEIVYQGVAKLTGFEE